MFYLYINTAAEAAKMEFRLKIDPAALLFRPLTLLGNDLSNPIADIFTCLPFESRRGATMHQTTGTV